MNRRDFLKLSSLVVGGFFSNGFTFLDKTPNLINDDLSKVTRVRYKDITLPLLTLGCMRFPLKSSDSSDIDTLHVQKMVDYAIAHGLNYFDTAYPYHSGKSEIVIGNALKKHPRNSFYISTKLPTWMINSEADVHRIFDEQLKKTQLKHFDFYFIHTLNKNTYENNCKKNKVYELLKKKKSEGKIKYLGFSFHDNPDVLEVIAREYPWDFGMIQLNYLDWDVIDSERMYEIMLKNNIPTWVMEPVRGGQLASLNERATTIFKNANPNVSTASWAIRYAASLPNVTTVLSGMSNIDQLQDNIKTMTNFKPLSDQERNVISTALIAYRSSGTIPCTNCKYCVPYCPLKIDIPNNFNIYNQFLIDNNSRLFVRNYNALHDFEKSSKCVKCKLCMPHCPQKIEIPNFLSKITEKYNEVS
ncbi:MAG: aldo/keto reductase [Elusimicrobiota bacterium]|jgi:predicted aldo/keto reductase-like oxidoreductase|nr:aldo/keto reductase [Elusimicrobiota bacterium]